MAGGIIGSLMYAVGFKFNSRGLNDADKKIGKLTKGVIGLGVAAGAAMVGIAAAGLKAAPEFVTAMKQIEGATGTAADQMEATREIAKNLYSNNFGEDWNDLGAAIANVQQVTGQTGDELERTTRNAILMRDQFGFEIPESIKSVDTMMKQFGITSEESFNLLAQGAQNGLDKSGELMDSANEYANQFKSLGFTADEMFDVFAAGSDEGVFQVDKIGDAVKEFNIRSKDGSKTTSDAFSALGLNAKDMMQTFARGGPASKKAFSDIISMISDIEDPVTRNNIGVALMGSQFEDLEFNVISAMGSADRAFNKATKTMDKLNKVKFEKPGEAFKMFGRQVEVGILIPIGQKLLPYLNAFGQWLADHKPQIEAVGNTIGDGLGAAIDYVSGLVQTATPYVQEFTGDFISGVQTLWPVLQDIGTAIYNVTKEVVEWEPFIPIVAGIAAALLTYKTIMLTVSTATKIAGLATKAWSGITKAFTAVQTAFNAVMAMNPIMLVVLALVGLGVALVVAYKRSDKFRAFIDKMWAGIKIATMAVLNFFKVTVPNAFKAAFDAVISFLKRWGVVLLTIIAGPLGLLVGLVIKHWDKVKATTVDVFQGVLSWLQSIWGSIKDAVSNAASSVWATVKNAWNRITESVKAAGSTMKAELQNIWDQVKGAASNVWNGITDGVKNMWGGIKDNFISGIDWLIDKLNGLIGKVNNALTIDLPDWIGGGIDISIPTIPNIDGSHKTGLARVPWDGYIAKLHKDERVLTAEDNKEYSRYTPETAPARAVNNGRTNIKMPAVTINIQGNADASTVSSMREMIRREMQDVFESLVRSEGLEGA